ncbi:MAG: hypothetical protein A2268_06120 [Candidatus Raymondbacteria bacterium RifOxyA12_full_50_37]|uniref:Methylenetetrahydrofolate reductase n=1 Tax=Candidatus Raymondbacteria bacterium RIFOXYD12_FULL_49_13 TaxID=1817890 RepID=A0A1F7FK32_UNCRA|nr:MAG: hypothetical protein A2268_06120 [Candidatus Raymondbacteria bacterium RifOxyA12_full_50_37]OGJ94544.1 MAG: hypothetical protein A2248_15050 [Candidatus Raymondbacteria bacterium RIFOXYA2_FULL_49_16]OGJ98506.1 MAG: hypothetical protein A2487_05415 [Candidatus Raymondbacteria bacterium RifOxyC12_full_50_8]OGK01693.1 MAG: hypothetical protein A2350_10780 [Candidatus Raymondbacteria bacterium RifOxyB12_full_50_8]OGK07020.1 MAG: hypothetical protein A2519_13690 [Candidatus Raymondbacteria b
MNIPNHIQAQKAAGIPTISIEILPPRNGENIENIFRVLDDLKGKKLDFISVTHGAGGSLRGGTEAISSLVRERYGIEPLLHLTCLEQSRQQIENMLMVFKYLGMTNILALRGDPPQGETQFIAHPYGHKLALDLMKQIAALNQGKHLIRQSDIEFMNLPKDAQYRDGEKTVFAIFGACYPEGHPEGSGPEIQRDYTILKAEAGARAFITQLIFDEKIYTKFMDDLKARGKELVVLPGIMPITRKKQLPYVKKFFKSFIPEEIENAIVSAATDQEAEEKGLALCAQLCKRMLKAGAPGIHFYSMNNGGHIRRILDLM